ncbi:hypothetical protein [Arthrobacter sp. YD2]|uniref:LysM peptidoglycan-binding domain-containing protein n=1 Tax=Arthrobacter sp. YD2 TaxID=3058046 RepID=UPI0025B3D110|nr:hypothetical protein [Arthrobacter sp. YD2]MDN3903976.1 hypothetical protein [Arthrobacter sp. YD2]
MRKPVIHPALAADALTAVAVAALGLLLLRDGAEILQALPASGARSGPSVSPESFELLAGLCAAGTGLVLTVWWVGGLICAAAGGILVRCGMASAGHRTMLLAPGPARRLAAAVLGLSLAAGSVPAIAAASAPTPAVSAPVASGTAATGHHRPPELLSATAPFADKAPDEDAVSPLWRPAPPQPPAGNVLTPVPRTEQAEVVVAAGDTLWSLAAEQLGPLATDAEIAAHWPRWHALNLAVVGPDPHLILPGQILSAPAPEPLPTPQERTAP